jgi:hypothetical protein
LKNPYVSLEVDKIIIRNDVKTNTVSQTKISDNDSNQKDNKHNSMRYCRTTKKPIGEPKNED